MDAQKEMPAISQGDFDLAVGQVTSFFQGKRAHLKKQVTHWYGKFMICKAENNAIRKKNKKLCTRLSHYHDTEIELQREVSLLKEESVQRQSQLDALEKEVESIKQGVGA